MPRHALCWPQMSLDHTVAAIHRSPSGSLATTPTELTVELFVAMALAFGGGRYQYEQKKKKSSTDDEELLTDEERKRYRERRDSKR